MCAMCRPRLRPNVDGPAKYTSPVLFLFIADSMYKTLPKVRTTPESRYRTPIVEVTLGPCKEFFEAAIHSVRKTAI